MNTEKWIGLRSIGMVGSEHNVRGVVSIEQRYYIPSIARVMS
jgi:hypothetical protein